MHFGKDFFFISIQKIVSGVEIKWAFRPIALKVWWGQSKCSNQEPTWALWNVESFQYLVYKRYWKTKSGPEQNLKVLNFSILRAQMALEIFAQFQPLDRIMDVALHTRCHLSILWTPPVWLNARFRKGALGRPNVHTKTDIYCKHGPNKRWQHNRAQTHSSISRPVHKGIVSHYTLC